MSDIGSKREDWIEIPFFTNDLWHFHLCITSEIISIMKQSLFKLSLKLMQLKISVTNLSFLIEPKLKT